MAATKGNQFWKQRSKHGREKIFETPDLMWEAACEYFEWCEENPLIEEEAKVVSIGNNGGSSIEMAEMKLMRPFTIQGLCGFLDVNTVYFNHFKTALKDKKDQSCEDFSKVITRIYDVIYQQKFEGAAVGLLNANIISRDLGLKDSSDITTNGDKISMPPIIYNGENLSLKEKTDDAVSSE